MDGFGDENSEQTVCSKPTEGNWIEQGGDCNDEDDSVHPEAREICDGANNDCDAETDETMSADAIVAGKHTCILTDGKVRCWGAGGEGQLGYGDRMTRSSVPAETVFSTKQSITDLAAGRNHTCAIKGGRVFCWGSDMNGALGDGDPGDQTTSTPVAVDLTPKSLTADDVEVGNSHGCLITRASQTICWGFDAQGQVGAGTMISPKASPVSLAKGSPQFKNLALGSSHSCGLTGGGDIYCWGFNISGQLGVGDEMDRREPTAVKSQETFRTIAAGGPSTCALNTDDEAFCWGNNSSGQLGIGTTTHKKLPTPVDTTETFDQLSVGSTHACALTKSGKAFCWGGNSDGQVGDGNTIGTGVKSPTAVKTEERFKTIATGLSHTCGITMDDRVLCWGKTRDGAVGDGSTSSPVTSPTATVCKK